MYVFTAAVPVGELDQCVPHTCIELIAEGVAGMVDVASGDNGWVTVPDPLLEVTNEFESAVLQPLQLAEARLAAAGAWTLAALLFQLLQAAGVATAAVLADTLSPLLSQLLRVIGSTATNVLMILLLPLLDHSDHTADV